MPIKVTSINCPSCGAPVSRSDKSCEFCNREIIVTNFSSVSSLPPDELQKYTSAYKVLAERDPFDSEIRISLGFCYLKLKIYDLACASFESAIEQSVSNPDVYFYTAVSLLRGKKAFLASRQTIDKIETFVNAAIDLEERPILYYFLAYIKYDFYSRKSYRTSPTYQEAHAKALAIGLNSSEVDELHGLINVQQPQQLQFKKQNKELESQPSEQPLEQQPPPITRNISETTVMLPTPSRKAKFALAMGVVSILGGVFLLIPPLLAIVFGHAAIADCKRDPNLGNKGFALAALILGWFCLIALIIAIALAPSK